MARNTHGVVVATNPQSIWVSWLGKATVYVGSSGG
jgi:hypothetical protein